MALIRIGHTVFDAAKVIWAQCREEYDPRCTSATIPGVAINLGDQGTLLLTGPDFEAAKAWLESVPEFASPPQSVGSVPAPGYQNPGPGYKPSVPTVDLTDPGMAYRPQEDTAGLRYGQGTRPEPLL